MPAPVRDEEENSRHPLVVGVGASAGGLEAFRELLAAVPPQSGMAFILVQHLDPTHKSLLVELLSPCDSLHVTEAEQGQALEPDTVYVIPPNQALAVKDWRIELSAPTLHRGIRLPIDHLFRSLADEMGPRAVGVLLSGAGSDGSAGLREIKHANGLTIAQNPSTASQVGMPESAIDSGVVDLVLPIAEIPAAIERFSRLAADDLATPQDETVELLEDSPSLGAEELNELVALLDTKGGFDLRHYKPPTIRRRVYRRMHLTGYNKLSDYLGALRRDPGEIRTLSHDLMIGVTEFFRDAEAFCELRNLVIEPTVKAITPDMPFRVWVPGCATGEEAYSIAIEILECLEREGRRAPIQIFATDVNEVSLQTARQGLYPAATLAKIDDRVLQKYFSAPNQRAYQVRPELRDTVTFALHDLCKDPPFSRMHLVSCRNLLIYLRSDSQDQAIRSLHFALNPGGFLFLGSSESVSRHSQLLSVVSKRWRIYKSTGISRPLPVPRSNVKPRTGEWTELSDGSRSQTRVSPLTTANESVRRLLLERLAPPSVVVTSDGHVVMMHGELEPFFRFPQGEPRHDLTSLIRPDLAARVRAAFYRCRRDREVVSVDSSPDGDRPNQVKITAYPDKDEARGLIVLAFETVPKSPQPPAGQPPESPQQEAIIDQLERELRNTREDLRNAVEELETANEGLRASNEEARSMNEELQSANEELESTTEELRSLNEELNTVNSQLRDKVEQLEQAHDDLSNFFVSTKLATLFLDADLRVRRFTPAAEELLSMSHADHGRDIEDIARELLQFQLAAEARRVLKELAPVSQELRVADGRWFWRQVLPYRTENQRIAGVVVTYLDITEMKEAHERLKISDVHHAGIARLGLLALEEKRIRVFLDRAAAEVQQGMGCDFCEILESQPDAKRLIVRASAGWNDSYASEVQASLESEALTAFALRTLGVVTWAEMAGAQRVSLSPQKIAHGVVSGVCCSIGDGDGAYGVVGAYSRTEHAFAPEHSNFLQGAASVIAAAIGAHQTRVRLNLESSFWNALHAATSLEDAVGKCFIPLEREIQASILELWKPTGDDRELRCIAYATGAQTQAGMGAPPLGEKSLQPGMGLIGRVFQTGAAEAVTSFRDGADFLRVRHARERNIAFAAAFPVRLEEQILGVMAVYTNQAPVGGLALLRTLESLGRVLGEFVRSSSALRAMRDSETRKAAIIDTAADAIVMMDEWGVVLEFNASAEKLFDIDASAVKGRDVAESLVPVKMRRIFSKFLAATREAADSYSPPTFIETMVQRSDGTLVPVELSTTCVRSGGSTVITAFLRDITAQKKAERDLALSERRFREIYESVGAELWEEDLAPLRAAIGNLPPIGPGELLSYLEANPKIVDEAVQCIRAINEDQERLRLLGSRKKPGFAASPTKGFLPEYRQVFIEQLIALKMGQQPGKPDMDLQALDGERKDLLPPVRFYHLGETLTALVSFVDNLALRAAEAELREANRQKDEFLAVLGHELRNPLAVITSGLELMEQEDLPEFSRVRTMMQGQAAQMSRLLDGLLDIARIDHGKIELDLKYIDLVPLIRQSIELHSHQIERHRLRIDTNFPSSPVPIMGDETRIAQIFNNLLSNAVKFTPDLGEIRIHAALEDDRARVRISDDGIGIAEEARSRIFTVFGQARKKTRMNPAGLGIGLALVKRLVELHGGTVSMESAGENQGTAFTLYFPVVKQPLPIASAVGSHAALPKGPLRILLVEDNQVEARLLSALLRAAGHQVTIAGDGETAFSMIHEPNLDAILCDIDLSGEISGLEVAREVLATGGSRPGLVALSGYGRTEDKQRSMEAGFDEHLTKPASRDTIMNALLKAVALRNSRSSSTQ